MDGDGQSRLDRIEGIIEVVATRQADLEDDFRRLLTAQVLLTDAQRKAEEKVEALAGNLHTLAGNLQTLTGNLQTLTGNLQALTEAQRHTDERLSALIKLADGIFRRLPLQPPE